MADVTIAQIIRRLGDEGNSRYFNWVRQVLTLASSGLVLLVSLQKNYIPDIPAHLWLLQLCWAGLGLSICLATVVLHGEGQSHFDAANELLDAMRDRGEIAAMAVANSVHVPKRRYRWSGKLLPYTILTSLVSLSAFATLNVQ